MPLVDYTENDAPPVPENHAKKLTRSVPSVTKARVIAKEAFIFGLSIVMNYSVINELVLNKYSGQYTAPF